MAAITFDPVTHEYRLPDGRLVPSVTQILRAVGVSLDFEEIRQRSASIASAIDYKRDLGTALHLDAHAYDDNDLVWATVHPTVRPYLDTWAEFRGNTGVTPLTRERCVYHPGLFYAGKLDGIFRHPTGKRILIEIKTGDPEAAGAAYQTAAYEMAWDVDHPDQPIDQRWAVQLMPGRSVPYRITNYNARPDAWRDGAAFKAFITTFFAQAARRRSA